MGVHGIDVEQVVLHLPDNKAELWEVAPEDAVTVHAPQVAVDTDLALEQLDKQAGVADIVAEIVVDQVTVLSQQADGVGAHAFDFRLLGHQYEDFQHGERRAAEHVVVACLDIAVMQLEACVDRLRRRFVFGGQDHLFEVLDDQVAELGNAHDHPVILLHEAFDAGLRVLAFKAQQGGDGALVVEQQPVFGTPGEHVQGVAHLPQEFLGRGQQGVFALYQKTFASQGAQVKGAVLATGHPQNRLNIPQAAGRAFDVGFQVVFGVVVLVVPGFLLGTLGQEEVLARPHVRGAGDFEHALAQALGAGDGAAFHEVGDDGEVGTGLFGALVDRAYALADFQANVPQQCQKTLDGIAKDLMVGAVQQDQQVDVGIGVQLATPVAADRYQGDVGVFAPTELFPGLLQNVIDEPGAVLDQSADIPATAKTLIKHLAGLADGLLERGDRARLQGQFGLELATVEEFGIHLGH